MVDVYDIALAALLHDIGKVMQRAEVPLAADKYDDRCPKFNNHSTHLHVKYTELFFEGLTGDNSYWQRIANLAASHHNASAYANPTDTENYWHIQCIILGDRISAMWDRKPDEEGYHHSSYKCKPLYSILNDLSLGSEIGSKSALPLKPRIPQGDMCFPVLPEPKTSKVADYKKLYEAFKGEFSNLVVALVDQKKIELPNFIDAIDSLLEKYFWSVPSNTNEENPSNSLYYHSKVSAGVAAALYSYYQRPEANKSELTENLINKDEKIFLLIGGDLSGIQNYIFDLHPGHSKKAAKTLRARSFKVKTLSEIVLQRLITELGLTRQNIMMNAGGKFMILAPNTPEVKDYMHQLRKEVDRDFFEQFMGSVSLNLDWSTEIAFRDLKMDRFHHTLDLLIQNLDAAKLHKFSSYLQDDDKWQPEHFLHQGAVYNSNQCPQCGKRSMEDNSETCANCAQEIALGEILPKTSHFVIRKGQPSHRSAVSIFEDCWVLEPFKPGTALDGQSFAFCIGEQIGTRSLPYPLLPVASSLPLHSQLRNHEQELVALSHNDDLVSDTLTLDELALLAIRDAGAGKYQGVPLNAVLKGDVDGLGNIFKLGFRYSKNGSVKATGFSITQYATLSAAIDWFFSVYLPSLIETDSRFTNKIYTVYAGGDDFCLIGPWNVMLAFVTELDSKFRLYCSDHPDLHFCAALTLLHGKSPIRFAITKAEDDLKKAKAYAKGKERKNAIRLFDTTVPWSQMQGLDEWAQSILESIKNSRGEQDGGITTQFLYRLLHYNTMALSYAREGKARDLLHKSYLIYDLTRNFKNHPEQAAKLQELASADELMKLLRVPIHTVIYSNRKYHNHGGNDEL